MFEPKEVFSKRTSGQWTTCPLALRVPLFRCHAHTEHKAAKGTSQEVGVCVYTVRGEGEGGGGGAALALALGGRRFGGGLGTADTLFCRAAQIALGKQQGSRGPLSFSFSLSLSRTRSKGRRGRGQPRGQERESLLERERACSRERELARERESDRCSRVRAERDFFARAGAGDERRGPGVLVVVWCVRSAARRHR